LYADARKWTKEGWLDYLTPQLYWEIESKGQSYPVLLQWWHQQNVHGRHLWPGNFTSRVGLKDRLWPAEEIVHQIETTRKQVGASGNVHFSFQAIQKNQGKIADALIEGPYAQAALVPASPWLDHPVPPQPVCEWKKEDGSADTLQLRLSDGKQPWLWAVQTQRGGQWQQQVVPGQQSQIPIDRSGQLPTLERIVVTPISRAGVAGLGVVVAME
jgi:hypothetical protein